MKTMFTLLGILFLTVAFPQQNASKNDIIMTSDGQLLQVKVVKVTEAAVSFNYPGESVINEIRPNTIQKIVFASGRTQNFSSAGKGASAPTAVASSPMNDAAGIDEVGIQDLEPAAPAFEEGLLSVVPIDFKRNGEYDKNLASAATKYVIGLMSNTASTKGIQVQQMGASIEKLIDSGFNYNKLRNSSPEELRGALGAEYLMYVSINEDEEKVGSQNDLLSATSDESQKTQLERTVNIRLYNAENAAEAFEIDFAEHLFVNNADNKASMLSSGKWKSSLRYLTEQLYASTTFAIEE